MLTSSDIYPLLLANNFRCLFTYFLPTPTIFLANLFQLTISDVYLLLFLLTPTILAIYPLLLANYFRCLFRQLF